jgi:hypothetical protein
MSRFDLPQRIRKRNFWWNIREDYEPVQCKACGLFGKPDAMVFVLLTDRTTGTYHRTCAPIDSLELA